MSDIMNNKPKCKLIGTDGNVFAIIGKVCRALEKSGQKDLAREFKDEAFNSESYSQVLVLCSKYVDLE